MEAIQREVVESERVELRVHGVSGTPVTSMLDDPHPVMVVGDQLAGFYRRGPRAGFPNTRLDDDDPAAARHLEAYSWGSLTAGTAMRAAWLLLLPFTLVNVAGWMHTDVSRSPSAERMQRGVALVLRLLALTLTLTLVLAAVGVGMDVVAWQRGLRTCAVAGARGQPLKLLVEVVGDCGSATMLAGAAIPLTVIAALWLLAWRTGRYEERKMDMPATEVPGVPLTESAYWDGAATLRRMRRSHLAAALALLGLMAARATDRGDLPPAIEVGVPLAAVYTIGLCMVWLVLPSFSDHIVSHRLTDAAQRWRNWAVLTTLLLATAVAVFAIVGLGQVGPPTDYLGWSFDGERMTRALPIGALPTFQSTVQQLFALQVLMLIVVLAGSLTVTIHTTRTGVEDEQVSPAALYGTGPALLASLGVLLGAAFAPALAVAGPRVADLGQGPKALVNLRLPTDITLPEQYEVASALSLVLLPVLVVIVVGLWIQLRRATKLAEGAVAATYGEEAARHPAEAAGVVKAQAFASLTDRAGGHVAFLTISALTVAAVSVPLVAQHRSIPKGWVGAGITTVTFMILAIVVAGIAAYRSRGLRRTVGILWDLGTFWPRSVHPLAPPCYSERTVPDIAHRLRRLTADGGEVLLSAHSQGSIIAAAVILRLDAATSERTALLTYGCPLTRLYGTYFPAYFGPQSLECLRERIGGRWRNLHRATDPIGGAVGIDGVDWTIERDPESLATPAEVPVIVKPGAHSRFPDHSQYTVAARELIASLPQV